MCKLTENSFRDVNIAFANELSILCENQGIDVWKLIELANRHPRVNILQPGTGVGGHCIAVDPWFIISRDPINARLMRSAREVNNDKTQWVLEKIKSHVIQRQTKLGRPPRLVCLGLAFKPDIDDLRESPAVQVVQALQSEGFDLQVVEPNIDSHTEFTLIELDDALKLADIVVILVKHRQFLDPVCKAKLIALNALDFCGVGLH
jgi:UDP-N-acetyl-D-mannosaminuronic acid dehydrogenase